MDTSTTSAAGNHTNNKMSSSVSTLSGGSDAAVLTMAQSQRQKLSKSPSAESLRSADSSASGGGTGNGSSGPPANKGYRAEDAVRTFGTKLASYEHTEIYNYPRVYFVGSQAKKRGGMIGAANNCGYDDENGSYLLVAHDHVAYRYEVLKVIGKGSFGQVRHFIYSYFSPLIPNYYLISPCSLVIHLK
jgi:dual specificity tyrosine-phosphorylation-regulated kinase 2/3/4